MSSNQMELLNDKMTIKHYLIDGVLALSGHQNNWKYCKEKSILQIFKALLLLNCSVSSILLPPVQSKQFRPTCVLKRAQRLSSYSWLNSINQLTLSSFSKAMEKKKQWCYCLLYQETHLSDALKKRSFFCSRSASWFSTQFTLLNQKNLLKSSSFNYSCIV